MPVKLLAAFAISAFHKFTRDHGFFSRQNSGFPGAERCVPAVSPLCPVD
jgi:hypothetical protein